MIMNNHSGTDLFDFIEHKEIIPEVTCHRIFTQLTDAVKYLAGKKIIHRDIKGKDSHLSIRQLKLYCESNLGHYSIANNYCTHCTRKENLLIGNFCPNFEINGTHQSRKTLENLMLKCL